MKTMIQNSIEDKLKEILVEKINDFKEEGFDFKECEGLIPHTRRMSIGDENILKDKITEIDDKMLVFEDEMSEDETIEYEKLDKEFNNLRYEYASNKITCFGRFDYETINEFIHKDGLKLSIIFVDMDDILMTRSDNIIIATDSSDVSINIIEENILTANFMIGAEFIYPDEIYKLEKLPKGVE